MDFCGDVCRQLSPMMGSSVRMALEGTSVSPGAPPMWLRQASDVRLVGIGARRNGASVLQLMAPRLGDAAEDIYSQNVLWDTKPDASETAVNVFARVIEDVASANSDSTLYDPHLLKQLSHSARLFRHHLTSISVPAEGRDKHPSRVDQQVVARAAELSDKTPTPRQVRIVGDLDMVRHSTRSFEMVLKDGKIVRGVLEHVDQIDTLKSLLGQSILVVGKAVYRPSGTLLRVDAQAIESGEGRPMLFSKVPPPAERRADVSRLRLTDQGRRGVPGFFGKWPGDETDEELLSALKELRG